MEMSNGSQLGHQKFLKPINKIMFDLTQTLIFIWTFLSLILLNTFVLNLFDIAFGILDIFRV